MTTSKTVTILILKNRKNRNSCKINHGCSDFCYFVMYKILSLFIIHQAMAVSLKFGVGNFCSEVFTHTQSCRASYQHIGTVAACAYQLFADFFYNFFVGVEQNFQINHHIRGVEFMPIYRHFGNFLILLPTHTIISAKT